MDARANLVTMADVADLSLPSKGEIEPKSLDEGYRGYDEYFDPSLERKYECPICLLGLREPVQTACGHRFCRSCIVRYLRDVGPKCPEDGECLTEAQIYPDNFAKREMMSLEVFCRMKELHGCTWKGPLRELEHHLIECPFTSVNCPNHCGEQMQRQGLQQHREAECFLRKKPCEYCQIEVLWNETEKHFESCSKYPLSCEKCEMEGIKRDEMEFHLEHHCPNVEIKCPFNITGCTFEGLRCGVHRHIIEQMPNHLVDLVKTFNNLKSDVSEREAVQRQNKYLLQGQASQEGSLSELATRTQHQRNEINEIWHIVDRLANTVHNLEQQLEESRARSLQRERRFCNGTYTWRIENYTQCREDAISGVITRKYSPAFCTSPSGYKLCMRINLNGVENGVGKHVALYVHMVQGDYDDTLDWPFTGSFTLSILDQCDDVASRHHISKTIIAEPQLNAFQRPVAPFNTIGFGYEEFACLEQICEPRYIKNNTMLVKFEINR